jgi:hypothetical protein
MGADLLLLQSDPDFEDQERRMDEMRKQTVEISVAMPKLPTIIGTVSKAKMSPTINTTRRSDRYAPATPTMATSNITAGMPKDKKTKLSLLPGMPVLP